MTAHRFEGDLTLGIVTVEQLLDLGGPHQKIGGTTLIEQLTDQSVGRLVIPAGMELVQLGGLGQERLGVHDQSLSISRISFSISFFIAAALASFAASSRNCP